MEFQTVLENRRSVRSYDDSKKVKKVTENLRDTRKSSNSQTARYYCILDADKSRDFAQKCLLHGNDKKVDGAALVVTTFVSNRAGFDREGNPDNECGNGWGYYDLGLHNENFILKAKELGLDTLIMGLRDSDKIREILGVPETETIVAVIAVGYGAESPNKPKRKTPEDIVKFY